MKSVTESMNPDEAAVAFYGQDEASFAEMLRQLTAQDPRLAEIFQRTRKRFLEARNCAGGSRAS